MSSALDRSSGARGRDAAASADLKAQILEELPEIGEIRNPDLREKVIEAWALALAKSSYRSIKEIPPAGNPGVMVLVRGDQTDHIRGVTRLAIKMADEFAAHYPELEIDRDIVVAGGICHDIGKPWEFDPENRKRWEASPRKAGKPSIRHPAFGAHICLTVGLPEEIAHIATAHSGEGELLVRSLENTIVNYADHAFWHVLVSGNMIDPATIPAKDRR
jgi:putative nucleotidyltransferase with HDIG domain